METLVNVFDKENKSFKLVKIKKEINELSKRNFLKKIKKKITNKNLYIIITKHVIEYIMLSSPFILMDYFIRKETGKMSFAVSQKYSYIFSYTFIIFYVFSSKSFKGNIGKIYYSILFLFYYILFITNIIFFSFTSNFFNFKILSYTNEGSHYMFGVIIDMRLKI